MRKLLLCLVIFLAACQKRIPLPGPTGATHGVHLQWNASTTPGVSYNIYRKLEACTGTAAFTKIAGPISGLQYDDNNLNEGNYCYQVTAYLASSTPPESSPSNNAGASINPPNPPSNLQVTPTAVTLNLGQQQQFTAMRGVDPVQANWRIDPPEGSINSTGLYTTPGSIKGNNVKVTVTATESGQSATADLTLRK